jgi:hypothetical protein
MTTTNKNYKAKSEGLVMTFTAATGLYAIAPDADRTDMLDQLSARLTQLEAMISSTCGAAGETFRSMSAGRQDAFMWACLSLAKEANELSIVLSDY